MFKSVTGFSTVREAKDYLAGKIAEEAEREGVPLAEVERKMLYFSESGWTLPDMMAVSAEFDRDYDQEEYERRIAGLVDGIRALDGEGNQEQSEAWDEAVAKLREGDHYLLVLINAAGRSGRLSPWLPALEEPVRKAPGDRLRLILVAVVGSVLLMLCFWLKAYLQDHLHF